MIREERICRSIPKSSEEENYFASIDELYQNKAWVNASFENISFKMKAPIEADESWLESQTSFSPILDLSDTTFGDSGLFKMREEQTELLHELKISNNPHLSDASLIWLAKHCSNLSILHAASCPRLTDKGLSEILLLPTLRYLNLEGNSITHLTFNKPSHLSALHLRNCSKLNTKALIEIAQNVPKLIYLAVSLKNIETRALTEIPLMGLNYLWLEKGEYVETEDLNCFLAQNPKLQILILENFPKITKLKLENHHSLQTLRFANCPKLMSLEGIEKLKLKDLNLISCPNLADIQIPNS